jgi:hypothetical protein
MVYDHNLQATAGMHRRGELVQPQGGSVVARLDVRSPPRRDDALGEVLAEQSLVRRPHRFGVGSPLGKS